MFITGVMFKKQAVVSNDFEYDLGGAEDYQFFINAAKRAKFSTLTVPLVQYRFHSQSFSAVHEREGLKGMLKIKAKFFKSFGIQTTPDVVEIIQSFWENMQTPISLFQHKELSRVLRTFLGWRKYYEYPGMSSRWKASTYLWYRVLIVKRKNLTFRDKIILRIHLYRYLLAQPGIWPRVFFELFKALLRKFLRLPQKVFRLLSQRSKK